MNIILIYFFIEVIILFFKIKYQGQSLRLITLMRIGSVLLLIGLDVSSAVTWDWRYYGLTAYLVLTNLFSLLRLLFGRPALRTPRIRSVLLRELLLSVFLILALLPAFIFPEYETIKTTGNYEVGTRITHITDDQHQETYTSDGSFRTLTVEFWYPKNVHGLVPVILFSHGAYGLRTSNESLFLELASHGYVVVSVDHTYQCFYTVDEQGKTILMNKDYFMEVAKEDAKTHKQESFRLYQKWLNIRLNDLNLVLDTLINESVPDITEIIDVERIGLIGHSLGGAAVLELGRARPDIAAVIALEAPFLGDITGVIDNEFIFRTPEYPVPVLNIYTDSSYHKLAQLPQYENNAKLLSGSDVDAYNLYLSGTGHLSITDLALTSPFLTRILNGQKTSVSAEVTLKRLNQESLEFFDCFLKDTGSYTPGD